MSIVTPEDFTRVRNQRPISDEVVQKYVNELNQGILDNASITVEKWAEVIVNKSFLDLPYFLCEEIAQKFVDAGWYAVYCTLGNSDKLSTAKWVFLTWEQEDNWINEKRDIGSYAAYSLLARKGDN